MTARINVTESLGAVIHDVAEGRLEFGALLEVIQNWETDMAARERTAIRSNQTTGADVLMATRARGMHLAVLALGVRLELLLEGTNLGEPAR